MDFIDYRKAKKGEITCQDCIYSHKPYFSLAKNPRLRCHATDFAVGRNMTCRYAKRRDKKEE